MATWRPSLNWKTVVLWAGQGTHHPRQHCDHSIRYLPFLVEAEGNGGEKGKTVNGGEKGKTVDRAPNDPDLCQHLPEGAGSASAEMATGTHAVEFRCGGSESTQGAFSNAGIVLLTAPESAAIGPRAAGVCSWGGRPLADQGPF